MVHIFENLLKGFGTSKKLRNLFAYVCEDAREDVQLLWKESWRLKDHEQLAKRKNVCEIFCGNDDATCSINQSNMISFNGSVDLMHENPNLFHIFPQQGCLSASIPTPISGLYANFTYTYPAVAQQLELEYVRLEHWLLKLMLPLSKTRIVSFGVTPQLKAFSMPCEISMKSNLNKQYTFSLASWSVGLKREEPSFSFAFKVSREKKDKPEEKRDDPPPDLETKATVSCKVETPRLSANVSWKKNNLECSFKLNDRSLSYISEAKLNFTDAKESSCSVGLGKKWDKNRGLKVILDTRNVTTITYSHRVDKKFGLQVFALVNAHNISGSHLKASFTFL